MWPSPHARILLRGTRCLSDRQSVHCRPLCWPAGSYVLARRKPTGRHHVHYAGRAANYRNLRSMISGSSRFRWDTKSPRGFHLMRTGMALGRSRPGQRLYQNDPGSSIPYTWAGLQGRIRLLSARIRGPRLILRGMAHTSTLTCRTGRYGFSTLLQAPIALSGKSRMTRFSRPHSGVGLQAGRHWFTS